MADNSLESNFISIHPAVEFTDVRDLYCYFDDLICNIKFNDYEPQEGDRIALFKIGWNLVKDYVVFEWAPVETNTKTFFVTFNKHVLPKNNTEIYQICYISADNELHGASSSFQFTAERINGTPAPKIKKIQLPEMINHHVVKRADWSEKQPEIEDIKKLKNENVMLKETISLILANKSAVEDSKQDYGKDIASLNEKLSIMNLTFSQAVINLKQQEADLLNKSVIGKQCIKNYDKEIEDLQKKVNNLESILNSQQLEIEVLKSKIIAGGEEYRKIYLEKAKLEKKVEKLKYKKDESRVDANNFNTDDLGTLPPFPFLKKM